MAKKTIKVVEKNAGKKISYELEGNTLSCLLIPKRKQK